ncbi:MAG: DinB family protein [Acidobacteria bacterium]|nr:DinB family protein [Acidobacteriota bacterium]
MLSFRFANDDLQTTLSFNKLLRLLSVGMVLTVIALPAMAQTTASAPAPAPATGSQTARKMTEKDREYAINQLKASREKFINSVAGLSEAQLKFKTAPDRWSVSEVAEHITLAEDFLFNIYSNQVLKTPATPEKERKVSDEQLQTNMTNRSTKFQAPEPIKPGKAAWPNITATMQEFEKRRARTIDFVKTTDIDLRSHFSGFGPGQEIDGLQWILVISGHVDRHVLQINEVKADTNFPKK